MKLEKEVYINKIKCIHNKDTGKVFTTLDIVFCDLLTKEEISKLRKLSDKTKLTLEVEEPILDGAERKYLSGVIRPFKDRIKFIRKNRFPTGREYIHIETKDNDMMDMFPFQKETMYKGLELNKEYKLEELGL